MGGSACRLHVESLVESVKVELKIEQDRASGECQKYPSEMKVRALEGHSKVNFFLSLSTLFWLGFVCSFVSDDYG